MSRQLSSSSSSSTSYLQCKKEASSGLPDINDERKPPAKKCRLGDHEYWSGKNDRPHNNNSRSNNNNNNNNNSNINPKHRHHHHYNVKPLAAKPSLFRTMDEVHRSISLQEPIIRLFLDSKYFQRLGRIKQLGTANFVYRSATHTRFEHSLGTAHLARRLVETISKQQPNLETTNDDILCIALAGLLHDVGHGPFSHIFEVFRASLHRDLHDANISETNPDLYRVYTEFQKDYDRTSVHDWPHERCSLNMIDAILHEHGIQINYNEDALDGPLTQIGDGIDVDTIGLTNRDFIFIKECIYGKAIPQLTKRVGRVEPKKEWLYDIVSNSHTGIDVDKLDYYARDAKRTIGEDDLKDTIIDDAVVARALCNNAPPSMRFMICYAEKRVHAIYKFFQHRFSMHEQVYQHKTTAGTAQMIVDILRYAEPYFRINGLPLSLSIVDAAAFGRVDDEILSYIEADPNPLLRPAQELIQRYKARTIYKIAGELVIDLDNESHVGLWQEARRNPTAIAEKVCAIEGKHIDDTTGEWMTIEAPDIAVVLSVWHEGRGRKNPLEGVRFVQRDHLQGSIHDELLTAHQLDLNRHPDLVKKAYQKQCIRLYARDPEKKDLIHHKFLAWKEGLHNGTGGQTTILSQLDDSGLDYGDDDNNNDDDDDDDDGHFRNGPNNRARATLPIKLTQDSDTETTPVKSVSPTRHRNRFESANRSPIPNFNILKSPPRSPAF